MEKTMSDCRESFVFYRSFHEALDCLPAEEYKATMQALCAYALDREEPEVSGIARALMALMKPQIDANQRRYENGKKGGAPKKEPNDNQIGTNTEPSNNQAATGEEAEGGQVETEEEPNDNQTGTNTEPNANANVNVNANVNDNANAPPPGGSWGDEGEQYPPYEYQGVKKMPRADEYWRHWDKVKGHPDPGGYWHFANKTWRRIIEAVRYLEPDDVYQAIDNYAQVKACPDTWWTTNPTSEQWAEKHIGRFMPKVFTLDTFTQVQEKPKVLTDWDRIVAGMNREEGDGRDGIR